MSNRYKGGVISATAPTGSGPYDTDTAKGVWTLDQAMQLKKQGLWPTAGNSAPLVIGQAYQGGFYAGQISTAGTGVADYNLVVGPVASAQVSARQWKTSNTSTAGTSSVIDGPANSTAMNNASHPAALFCKGLTVGGYSDWYLPAKNELDVCYFGLKPTTTSNNTSAGVNDNSVPTRTSTYSAGTPPQTSAADFVSGTGAEAYSTSFYWSSTEASATVSWTQYFDYGRQLNNSKISTFFTRAIRRVAV